MPDQRKGAVLISGASTGIGRAVALLLDRHDYRVFAGVRNADAAQGLRAEASKRLLPVMLDVTDQTQIAEAVKSIKEALNPQPCLTAIINNAGICVAGPTELLPLEILRHHLEVNIVGHIAVTQAFLPLIRSGKGRIINVGSATGRFALPYLGAYSASKFAMVALSDALRVELLPWDIFVSLVEPGTVETPMWKKSTEKSNHLKDKFSATAKELYEDEISAMRSVMDSGRRRAITPREVAMVIQKVLEARRPKSRYAIGAGARMAVIGNLLPNRLTDWVFAKVLDKKLSTKALGW